MHRRMSSIFMLDFDFFSGKILVIYRLGMAEEMS
jgi:hypothetical protein